MIMHVYLSQLVSAFARLFLCVAVVGNSPVQWLLALCAIVVATINHQAGGEELLLCSLAIILLRYAKIRMVNTDFSRQVLIVAGYSALEMASYALVMSVASAEAWGHIGVVIGLFLLYTLVTG